MRSLDLYTAMRAVDDDILERSETASYGQKKNGWLTWGAIAACFGHHHDGNDAAGDFEGAEQDRAAA